MNGNAAKNLAKTTFENPYGRERFLTFTKNLFHFFEPKTFVYRGNYIPDAYKNHVKTLERMGKYEDKDRNKIDILAVQLIKPTSLERARTLQRNFIAWYLNGSRGGVAKDGALVAFYAKDFANWRLSLVKMDYHLGKTKAGKLKAITELTPARRFSFLVGKDENTHTAQKQLLPILLNDQKPPTLSDFEEAFSVEVVTKDFFEKYKALFLNTKESLDEIIAKDTKIKADFTEKNIDTVDFAKKLLGQIVFLYFLQKKGWFGVARDEDWGTGPKDFLRRLFEKAISDYDNFFNDILEPLFYEALAIERPDDFYSRFNCKIPFLNGGLFDPLNNYDWVHTDIHLPDSLFSNSKRTKEGDIGDGILDVFDRYNFTVKEDEPLEREVAVDPEMLGKVFENLLEVKDRKSKGTYYTPREIVHYMCQESLVNYLTTESEGKVKREDIETLIRLGETAVEHDSRVVARGEETETYKFKLPQSVRKNASSIDESLEKIKVCDPAVGSGAFLVGMMTEVIRTRNTLSSYLPKDNRSIYAFKRHAIQNCLYGVDIDPGAVEIAKLRLWLSLVVDEQEREKIQPLPNLDYKIMQGNSLLEEYEGIKLFDEGIISASPLDNTEQIEQVKEKLNELQREFFKLHSSGELKGRKKQQIEVELERQNDLLKKLTKPKPAKSENSSLFDRFSEAKQKADELKKLHQEFFEAAHKKDKDRIKREIEALEWDLIETTLREQDKQSLLPEIERFKKANIKPFFLWKLNFSEVFEKNGGFDVVIANPPYLKERDNKKVFEIVNKSDFGKKYHQGKMDYWYYFLHKAIDVIKSNGIISYITSRYWLRSQGAKKLIQRIKDELSFINFVDIGKLKVFDNVAGLHMVAVYLKNKKVDDFVYKKLENDLRDINKNYDTENLVIKTLKNSKLITNDNEISLEEESIKLENCVSLGEICEISQGVVEAPARLSKNQLKELKRKDVGPIKGVFVLTKKEVKALNLNRLEKRLIKKYLNPNDIFKYGVSFKNKKFLIYSNGVAKNKIAKDKNFKNIKKHLDNLNKFITSSNAPYGLHRPRNEKYFEQPKIIFKNMFVNNEFTYDTSQFFVGFSFSAIISKNKNYDLKYLLAILNSKLGLHWFLKNGKKRGAGVDIGVRKLRSFPIKKATLEQQKPLVKTVDGILALTKSFDYLQNPPKQQKAKEHEKQIDQLVYKLYGLTPEEIKIIERGT